jgi:hypothetical protein
MNRPGKRKPGATWRERPGLKLLTSEYRTLDLRQAPFRFEFWRIEQGKARIQDLIEQERTER